MAFGKGVAVWISGFFTFLAGLNTFNAVMLWVYKGADLTIESYLMNNILGISGMPVTIYFWVSLIAAFGFLGLTSLVAYSGPSSDQDILKMIGKVEEGLADTRRKIEAAKVGLFAKLETDRMERQQLFDTVNANIGNASKEMRRVLEKIGEVIQKDLSTTQVNLSNTRKEMRDLLEKQGKALQKQRAELEDMKARLETLERAHSAEAETEQSQRASKQEQNC